MSSIRLATHEDLPAINEIYNQAVAQQYCTADTQAISLDARKQWFSTHNNALYPVWVYCMPDNQAVAWLSVSAYRQGREALRFTAEVSYYVHRDFRRCGISSQLMEHALPKAKAAGIKNLFAILLDVNQASIALLKKFGFTEWGHLPRVADFNGTEIGQYYYGKRL